MNKDNKDTEIRNFWNEQALTHGTSSLATMPDQLLKELEIENIADFLNDGMYVADIGCGNGFSSLHYANAHNIKLHGIDYSEEMIKTANVVLGDVSNDVKERLSFSVGDVRKLNLDSFIFDTVITDRCLINLTTRDDQSIAIKEIYRILKPSGLYLMCEDSEQGLSNLNSIRKCVGLDEIKVRWHNLYLDELHILSATDGLFELIDVRKFSSFYYLASRIINGKVAQEQGIDPQYDSDINRIARICSSEGDFGDFGPLKLFVFRKICEDNA